MKKYILTAVALLLCGCGGFLEEYSQNEVRPKHVTDLQMLMVGEAYPVQDYFAPYLDLLTDDVQSGFTNKDAGSYPYLTTLNKGEGPFTWNTDMFDLMSSADVGVTDTWERYYSRIKACNIVLDYVGKVEGTVDEKEKVTGEALAIRSFYYFQLVNLYAKPYNAPGIDRNAEPGISLLNNPTVSDLYPTRSTLQQVYDQIEGDLLTAMPLMDKHGRNQTTKYRASDLFVHTLLSRFYLYTEQWDKAEEHASIVLQRKSLLVNLSSYAVPYPGYASYPGGDVGTAVLALESPELIWGYSQSSAGEFSYDYFFGSVASGDNPPFSVSQSLKDAYEYDITTRGPNPTTNPDVWRGDLRVICWYSKYQAGASYLFDLRFGNSKSAGLEPMKGMRTAELYLNRAEANAQMFIAGGNDALRTAALADLNTLRAARYDTRTVAYTPIAITDGQELLQFVREERRRELSFEEHRWFDLRRWGMPEIRHTFKKEDVAQVQEYILQQGDARYTLPIASWVLARNPNLQ